MNINDSHDYTELASKLVALSNKTTKVGRESFIKSNLTDELFVKTLKFLLNDFVTTGIGESKLEKDLDSLDAEFLDLESLLSYLEKNNTGRDIDVAVCQFFLYTLTSTSSRLVLEEVITKKLRLGITAKTWNKIVPRELQVPVFSVMLAKKYKDQKKKLVDGEPIVITQKLDGLRLVMIKSNGEVKSYTRTGKPYVGLNQIEQEVLEKFGDNVVLDGELLSESESFTDTMHKARSNVENKTGLVYNVFDMLPLQEFLEGKSSKNAIERKHDISAVFSKTVFYYIKEVTPLYIGTDHTQIGKWFEWSKKVGAEGIMINLDKPYQTKRTGDLLKVKQMNTCDVRVISVVEGEGKNSGKLGAIEVEFTHKGKLYTCMCGSGFSDAERNKYYKESELLVGKIVEIQYFEISQNSDGKYSLRFPVWLSRIREDKTSISMY